MATSSLAKLGIAAVVTAKTDKPEIIKLFIIDLLLIKTKLVFFISITIFKEENKSSLTVTLIND
jgi:hypothetical protein